MAGKGPVPIMVGQFISSQALAASLCGLSTQRRLLSVLLRGMLWSERKWNP